MSFELNPKDEVKYRVRMARRYMEKAGEAYRRGDYRGVVASSQLSVENAAKAIISVYRIPS